MASAILLEEDLCIPFVATLDEFRQWARSDEFPKRGRIDYIAGQIEVDMSPEDLFMHGSPKTKIAMTIALRVEEIDGGEVFIDRTRISCPPADLSVEPDVVYISHETLDSGKIKLTPKITEEPDRYIEIEGAPDLVVEIVSDSSERKDTKRLPIAYFLAGVKELWIVDVRSKKLHFEINRRGRDKFIPVAVKDGFQRSALLDRSYKLIRTRGKIGHPKYKLHDRA